MSAIAAAWAELALHLRTRAGGHAAIARQELESATRVEARCPDEARGRVLSAEYHNVRAQVAAELAEVARRNAEERYDV